MTDDRFDERLRQAAQDYHRPPVTPREELWHRIAAARAARRRHVIVVRPTLRWGVGIAAVLALGVAIGRWSARRGESPSSPTVIAGSDQASTLACALSPHRTSSRIAPSKPSSVSGYIRPPINWRIIRIDWVKSHSRSATGLSQTQAG